MIVGAHSIIYSTNPEADRAFLRDVLGLPNVDVGEGWLIFGLPPAEVAVHPSNENDVHELYFMCDDVQAFIGRMGAHGVVCEPAQDQGWGVLTQLRLPGGGKLGVYEPRHARPKSAGARPAAKAAKATTRRTRKPARKRRPARAKARRRPKARARSRARRR